MSSGAPTKQAGHPALHACLPPRRLTSCAVCLQSMANHYAHFITNDDLDALYCYGITHVRVPVAYWMVLPDHSRLSACMPMHAYALSWCIVALKARVIHPCHRTGRRASASTRSLPMASMLNPPIRHRNGAQPAARRYLRAEARTRRRPRKVLLAAWVCRGPRARPDKLRVPSWSS